LLPHLPELSNSTSSKQALDIGAGSGRDAAWLAAEGWNVVAVEPALGLIVLGVILPVGRLCVGWMILYLSWLIRDSVRAKLRNLVRRALRKWKYPPDGADGAIDLCLQQAEVLSETWSAKL
jgi:hypothetical protein